MNAITEAIPDKTLTPLDPADHFTELQLILFQVLISLVAVFGVLGNLLVAAVVLTFRRWRVPTNIFLCNVAFADLLICFWTLPLVIGAINKGKWPLPEWMCSFSGFLDNASYITSAWSLALGSIERFYLVLSRSRGTETMSHSVAILLCGCIWIFAVILAALPVLGWNRYVYSPLTFSCAIDAFMAGLHRWYFILFLVLVIPGPLIVILFNYSYVFIFIARLPARHQSKRRNHLSIVIPLVIMTVAFMLCSLPTTVILVMLLRSDDHKLASLTPFHYNIIHWVLLLDSCINPMICAFLSKKFRSACKQLLRVLGEIICDTLHYACIEQNGCLHSLKDRFNTNLSDSVTKLRKDAKALRRRLCKSLCPKIFQSEMDNVVIKVTINNRSGLDPLLSRGMVPEPLTQLTSLVSSRENESYKRQNSAESHRPSADQAASGGRRISGERANQIHREVIEEEVEPILVWCSCGQDRCRCAQQPIHTPV